MNQDESLIYNVDTRHGTLKFYCPSNQTRYRAKTLLTKEPDTIAWIESFDDGDCFWDIGASVGVYSLYAGLVSSVETWAFEPSPFNYRALCRNIGINNMASQVFAFCLAFDSQTTIFSAEMVDSREGGGANAFASRQSSDGSQSQSVIAFRLDDFIDYFHLQPPNHIKIDVEGCEDSILEGARKLLKRPQLRSVLVEMDDSDVPQKDHVCQLMEASGLEFNSKAASPLAKAEHAKRNKNFLFVREERD